MILYDTVYKNLHAILLFSLPKDVQRRIKALKKLQSEIIDVESDFYKDMHKLEIKYAQKYTALSEKVNLEILMIRTKLL